MSKTDGTNNKGYETQDQEDSPTTLSESTPQPPSKMKDAFVSFIAFVIVTILTHGFGGQTPFVLPSNVKVNEGTPVAANPPNLRTKSAPSPAPFLGSNSGIDDYFGGDVFAAFTEADLHENSLIFFYAPWDADSIAARSVLEIISDIFSDSDLYICAVNCWHPKGECYKQFGSNQDSTGKKDSSPVNNRLPQHQYPILVFYPRDRKGVQYHGPITVEAIVEFLLSARSPVVHIRSKSDLLNLQARHNGRAMVGYFPDLTSPKKSSSRKSFRRFLATSYHFLESDPFRVSTGGIGAVTSERLAYKLHLGPNQPVKYFFWNGTSAGYPNKTITSANSLIRWAVMKSEEATPLTSWIGVLGRKSLWFSRKLLAGTGNSLLVFIPRINRFIFNEALSVVQEVSVQYKSCQESNNTSALVQTLRTLRRESNLKTDSLLHSCRTDPWFAKNFENRPLGKICFSEPKSNLSLSGINKLYQDRKFLVRRKPVLGRPLMDSRVSDLQRMHNRLECTLAHYASSILKPMSSSCDFHTYQEENYPFLSGLGCSDNRTLNFYTLDYHSQLGLAASLGLDEKAVHALIVKSNEETYYVMKEEFTVENLARFVINFHSQPELLTEAKLSHGLIKNKSNSERPQSETAKEDSSTVKVDQLSRSQFMSKFREKPLLLLYVSPSCGFCGPASRSFLTVKQLLAKKSIDFVDFSTIDTYNNDLPWSFTAISAPTVIYIPPGNGSHDQFNPETRVFPLSKPLSVHNLLNFVLANLPLENKIQMKSLLTPIPSEVQGTRPEQEDLFGKEMQGKAEVISSHDEL